MAAIRTTALEITIIDRMCMVALRRGEVAVIAQWSNYPTRMELLRVGPKANFAKATGGRQMFGAFAIERRPCAF